MGPPRFFASSEFRQKDSASDPAEIAFLPTPCPHEYQPHRIRHWAGAGGWPHPFKPNDDGTPSFHATPAKIATAQYYDSVNFARRIKAPGFYTWGYNDDVCPPTSTYAAFNVITAPKTLAIQPEQGHNYPQEQWEVIDNWVTKQLGLK